MEELGRQDDHIKAVPPNFVYRIDGAGAARPPGGRE
jgi:hypothetical protein